MMTKTHETTMPITIPTATPIDVTENSKQHSFIIGLLTLLLGILDADTIV